MEGKKGALGTISLVMEGNKHVWYGSDNNSLQAAMEKPAAIWGWDHC